MWTAVYWIHRFCGPGIQTVMIHVVWGLREKTQRLGLESSEGLFIHLAGGWQRRELSLSPGSLSAWTCLGFLAAWRHPLRWDASFERQKPRKSYLLLNICYSWLGSHLSPLLLSSLCPSSHKLPLRFKRTEICTVSLWRASEAVPIAVASFGKCSVWCQWMKPSKTAIHMT